MRRLTLLCIVLLAVPLRPALLHAEESLGWRECVREARERHPDLALAKALLLQAEADRRIAGSGLRPSLSLSAFGTTGATAGSGAAWSSSTFSYALSARQLLYDGRKSSELEKASAESVRAAGSSLRGVSADVRFLLRSAYTGLLKAQETVGLTREILGRRRSNARLIALRYRAGREHLGSLRRAEADLAEAEFEAAQAERGLRLARALLSSAIGRPEGSAITVAGSLETPVPKGVSDPDFQALAGTNPLVLELEAGRKAALYGLNAAGSAFAPELYLGSSAGKSAVRDWPPENTEWQAGLELAVPIYEGGAGRARVSKARAALGEAEARLRSGMLGVLDLLRERWKGLQDARGRLEVRRRYLEAAVERSRIADAQYSNGLISFDDWVIIEDNLVSAKKEFLNAGADLSIAEAAWIQAKGGGLDEIEG